MLNISIILFTDTFAENSLLRRGSLWEIFEGPGLPLRTKQHERGLCRGESAENTSKSRTLDKTKNEKDRPEPTPEKTAGTAELDSLDLGVRRELKFERDRSVFVICIFIEKKKIEQHSSLIVISARSRGFSYRYPIIAFCNWV